MQVTLLAALAAFQSLSLAAPTANTRYVQHERRGDLGATWVKREIVAPTFTLPMRIGLNQGNLHRGHDMLMDVADPDSKKYGQHYTVDEITDFFAPPEDSVAAVRAWLHEFGIAPERISQSTNKQWLQFDAKTQEAEDLLKTKFHIYEHTESGRMSIGCDEYHVESAVQPHIDYITPGVKALEFRNEVSQEIRKRAAQPNWGPLKTPMPASADVTAARSSLQYCASIITPNCIFAMYNITAGTTAVKGNELGIFEEEGEWLDQRDLNLYFKNLYPQIPQGTFPTVDEIDGAVNRNNPKVAGTEALLDVEISYPIIWPQNSVFYLTDDAFEAKRFNGGLFNTFLDAIDGSYCTYSAFGETGDNKTVDPIYPNPGYKHPEMCGTYRPTNVISFSYELAEYNEGTSANYQKRQCNEYMKLGLQGVSVVFSSGDSGVATNWGCIGTRKSPIFNVNFPSNCPYVTSVGATTLTGKAEIDHERATTQFPSGGGFSNFFARPSYQDSAVEAFFNSAEAPTYPYYTGSDATGYYNRSGRGYPDVAAIGQAVVNYGQGQPYLVGGTSASAPTFAAILTRINEERLSAGKSTVGFVNPTLYKNPQAFHDITVGSNPACGTQGFSCAPGWDPVTGLGTPNYPELLKAFMAAS